MGRGDLEEVGEVGEHDQNPLYKILNKLSEAHHKPHMHTPNKPVKPVCHHRKTSMAASHYFLSLTQLWVYQMTWLQGWGHQLKGTSPILHLRRHLRPKGQRAFLPLTKCLSCIAIEETNINLDIKESVR